MAAASNGRFFFGDGVSPTHRLMEEAERRASSAAKDRRAFSVENGCGHSKGDTIGSAIDWPGGAWDDRSGKLITHTVLDLEPSKMYSARIHIVIQ